MAIVVGVAMAAAVHMVVHQLFAVGQMQMERAVAVVARFRHGVELIFDWLDVLVVIDFVACDGRPMVLAGGRFLATLTLRIRCNGFSVRWAPLIGDV